MTMKVAKEFHTIDYGETEARMKALAAGKDCDAYCGKCKMMLAHVIHAMDRNGRDPARVECKTCNAVHKYKGHLPGTRVRTRSTTPRKAASAKRTKGDALFDDLTTGVDISSPLPYGIDQDFQKDSVILHQKFGLGLVTRAMDGRKVEVAFRDEVRVLVHQR